jgi:acyl carrier protein
MTRDEVSVKIVSVFQKVFNNNELIIAEEYTASDVEGWDSITHLDLIVAVEHEFSIEINGFDVMGLQNVGDLIDLVVRKIEG